MDLCFVTFDIRKMKMVAKPLLVTLLFASQLMLGLTFPSTAPAFFWSPQYHGFSNKLKEAVNYQILSPKDLAKSVMSIGGWSNLLCPLEERQQFVDFALLFVGEELHSSDISGHRHADPALVDLLRVSLKKSNFSLAFPYIAASEGKGTMETSLISEIAETCGHDLGCTDVAFLGSCSLEGENFQKLADDNAVHDYLVSRMQTKTKGRTNLIVFCYGGSGSLKQVDRPRSEGQIFSELISSVEQSGAKYTVLYVSDPFKSIGYPSYRGLQRYLSESVGSANSTTCDGVCQIKSSLMEGILVGIVLLIILISGLCCMMGIDTPTRFETPQDS